MGSIETRAAFSDYRSRISAREAHRRADDLDNALQGELSATDGT